MNKSVALTLAAVAVVLAVAVPITSVPETHEALVVTFNDAFLRNLTAATTHYGDPFQGPCESDEVNITISGVQGSLCSPACEDHKCPTDVPAGVTAVPQCALKDAKSGEQYCALLCTPNQENPPCGTATCRSVGGGVGLCTYSD